ncbi:MAG: hypothetical protein LIR46_12870 [Bacteroidota bacterium]|nr:hypothetical protein [Bacteroidota bacterium]
MGIETKILELGIENEIEKVLDEMKEEKEVTSKIYMLLSARLGDLSQSLYDVRVSAADKKQVEINEERLKHDKKAYEAGLKIGEEMKDWMINLK